MGLSWSIPFICGGAAYLVFRKKRYALIVTGICVLIKLRKAYGIFFQPGPSSYTEASIRNDQGVLLDTRGQNNQRIYYSFLAFRMHGQINRLSPRCLIFFHGNAEDVGDMMPMLRKLRDGLQTNIIAVEYPGYGLTYGRREPTPQVIKQDAVRMYDFVSRQLGFSHENIVVYGRSIGSGAASHIAAAHREVRSLILQSPIASVRKIAADKVGPVANLIMIENFYDNEQCLRQTAARVLILHGQNDEVVPVSHAHSLAQSYNTRERHATMELVPMMGHNNINRFLEGTIIPAIYGFMNNNWVQVTRATAIDANRITAIMEGEPN